MAQGFCGSTARETLERNERDGLGRWKETRSPFLPILEWFWSEQCQNSRKTSI